jgi:hypothetical protein
MADDDAAKLGRVLVHNQGKPGRRMRTSEHGARYWLQALDDTLEPCDCGWVAFLDAHYRVKPPT